MAEADEPSADGENADQRQARIAHNAQRTEQREQERINAERQAQHDQGLRHNLAEEFDRVGNRRVSVTPSANIAVGTKT